MEGGGGILAVEGGSGTGGKKKPMEGRGDGGGRGRGRRGRFTYSRRRDEIQCEIQCMDLSTCVDTFSSITGKVCGTMHTCV